LALNDTVIRTLKPKPGKTDRLVADGRGLYVRARRGKKGEITRTWQFRRKDSGKLAITPIGVYPAVSLKEARTQAAALAAKRRINAPTVAEAAGQWLSEVVDVSLKSAASTRWYIDRACLDIGDMRIDDVTPKDVADVVRRYRDTVRSRRATAGGRTAARLMLSALKQLFSYAVARGWVSTSPAAPISQLVIGAPRKARGRVLTDAEIQWVMESSLPPAPVWRFLLATALRVAEAYHGHRDGQYWIVPASKSKNGVEHRVWLSPLALAQLEAHPWAAPKWQTQTTLSLLRLGWSCHDLRRTFSTRNNDMGVAPHVVERLLNHRPKGVAGTYDRADRDTERRQALEAWSRWLKGLVEKQPADVVSLRQVSQQVA
jgi:integrase